MNKLKINAFYPNKTLQTFSKKILEDIHIPLEKSKTKTYIFRVLVSSCNKDSPKYSGLNHLQVHFYYRFKSGLVAQRATGHKLFNNATLPSSTRISIFLMQGSSFISTFQASENGKTERESKFLLV